MATQTLEITTEDIEYLRHGDRAMLLRLFKPAGTGPLPAIIDLHPGAWCTGDMAQCRDRHEVLAGHGFAVASLDFRHAGDGYPTSLMDINYAIRWLKAHAGDLGIDPDRVCLVGQSSGGHLAMLAAMRPEDPRYASIALDAGLPPVDASVRCVGMLWPVINPLSRYRYAKRVSEAEPESWAAHIPERHDIYWKTEEAMAEGNPVLMLENGEAVQTPPAIWIQGRPDPVHDYLDIESDAGANEPERFAADYRKAGGEIEMVYIEQETRASRTSVDPLAEFCRKHVG